MAHWNGSHHQPALFFDRVKTRVVAVVVRELLFPCGVSDLFVDQRSQVRGNNNSLPLSFRFSSTAVFLTEWIRNTISMLPSCKHEVTTHHASWCTWQQWNSSTPVCHWPASGRCPSCCSSSSFLLPQLLARLSSVNHAYVKTWNLSVFCIAWHLRRRLNNILSCIRWVYCCFGVWLQPCQLFCDQAQWRHAMLHVSQMLAGLFQEHKWWLVR